MFLIHFIDLSSSFIGREAAANKYFSASHLTVLGISMSWLYLPARWSPPPWWWRQSSTPTPTLSRTMRIDTTYMRRFSITKPSGRDTTRARSPPPLPSTERRGGADPRVRVWVIRWESSSTSQHSRPVWTKIANFAKCPISQGWIDCSRGFW